MGIFMRRDYLKFAVMPAMIGAVAMIAQVAYLRLTAQSFYGNELTMCIVLGHWLIWTGLGSLVGARLVRRNLSEKWLTAIVLSYGMVLIIFAGLLFLNRRIAGIPAGTVVGLGTIFAWTFILFSLPAWLNGLFFPLIVNWVRVKAELSPVHTVYAGEVIGSALGSLLFAGLILSGVSTIDCLLVIVWVMMVLAIGLFIYSERMRIFLIIGASLIVILASVGFRGPITNWKWAPFKALLSRESPHLALTTVRYQDAISVYGDSQPLWTFGDREKAEEWTHFALLNHPDPRSVLVIGIGSIEICHEISRHPSVERITILQPDRVLHQMVTQFGAFDALDTNVQVIFADPALYLGKTDERFDVVLMNIPLPVNAQWNRFYTREFFEIVHSRLSPGGLLMLNLPGDEEFLPPAQVEFLKTMQNTANRVFQKTTWIPGLTVHLLASDSTLHNDRAFFLDGLRSRNLEPIYISDYFLHDRLSDWKIAFLTNRISEAEIQEVNTIARPIGYYYDTVLWGQRTGGLVKKVYPFLRELGFIPILIGFIVVILIVRLISHRKKINPAVRMAGIGFWVMGLESVAIILFQSLVGSVYLWIVFLTFAYMLGSGLGAIMQLKWKRADIILERVGFLLMLILPFLLALPLTGGWPILLVTLWIGLILFIGGIVAGCIFPLMVKASTVQADKIANSAGLIYAADIFGSTLGTYLISGIVIPVYGIIPALGIVVAVELGIGAFNFPVTHLTEK
jgi:spermidine synthase